ncbi:MAG: hypothetical protein K2X08_00430, partial [Chlamydiales bacterium]|nr:hypothetical protein [Chlamydiales bacterium]
NRMMLADFTPFEHHVVEEILFSSLKISSKKFSKSLECTDLELCEVLDKLAGAGLLSLEGDIISVDKEMRKYFECEIARFAPEFKPDMDFLQGLLRKVPIHILPTWYAIPRTSSNIFESILEKYLSSPQVFNRHLSELHFNDPKIQAIIQDVYTAPQLQVSSTDLIARYNLSKREFEEIMLLLEFHFVCCLWYIKEDDHWIEVISPFYEWRQYLLFLQQTTPSCLSPDLVTPFREGNFPFIEDMTSILQIIQKTPLFPWDDAGSLSFSTFQHLIKILDLPPSWPPLQNYLTRIIKKLCIVHLASITDGKLCSTGFTNDWLELSVENKASYLHRHPMNQIIFYPVEASLNTEKQVHESEKLIKRVIHGEWVYFEDFLQGALMPFDEPTTVSLKKTGKAWRYTLPQYSKEQKEFIQAVVFEWLFEAGMVALGNANNRDCFRVTPLGRCFFQ